MSPRETTGSAEDKDCRCACKRLLARATSRGVEIKCGRCERLMLVTWPDGTVIDLGSAERPVPPRRK